MKKNAATKPRTSQKKTKAKARPTAQPLYKIILDNNRIKVVIIEPRKIFRSALKRDIERLAPDMDVCALAENTAGIEEILAEHKPQLVMLSSALPNNEAQQFLSRYEPNTRPFVVILVSTNEMLKEPTTRVMLLDFIGMMIAGHLVIGQFGNEDLLRSLEHVRQHNQRHALQQKEQQIVEALLSRKLPFFPDEMPVSMQPVLSDIVLEDSNGHLFRTRWELVVHIHIEGHYYDVLFYDVHNVLRSVMVHRGKLLEFAPYNDDKPCFPYFIWQTHRAEYVNVHFISYAEKETLRLITGLEVPITPERRNALVEILCEHSQPLHIIEQLRIMLSLN